MTSAEALGEALYQGKAKTVYAGDGPDTVRVYFRDDATAFDGKKKGTIEGKGERNLAITAALFERLEAAGIPTHLVAVEGPRVMLCRRVEIIPVEVVVRNKVAGSLAGRLGLEEGTPLERSVLEYYYKRDDLGDPIINTDHVLALRLASEDQLAEIDRLALQVNDLLRSWLAQRGLDLIDFKLEFGRDPEGTILLADEISGDTCRFWDKETGRRLDKDRFRRDLGDVEAAYEELAQRILQDEQEGA